MSLNQKTHGRILTRLRPRAGACAALIGVLVLGGCGVLEPRVNTSSPEAYQKSLDAIEAKLTPDQAKDFRASLSELVVGAQPDGLIGSLALGPAGVTAAKAAGLDGKTGHEIIVEGLKKQIQADNQAATEDLAYVQAAANERRTHQAQLEAIQVSGARYSYSGSYVKEASLQLTVANKGAQAIKRIYMHGVLTSPGRSIPWVSRDFNYEFPGGLEAGETRALDLSPRGFDWEGSDFEDRRDLSLAVTVLNVENANGEQLLSQQDDLDTHTESASREQQEIVSLSQKLKLYGG